VALFKDTKKRAAGLVSPVQLVTLLLYHLRPPAVQGDAAVALLGKGYRHHAFP